MNDRQRLKYDSNLAVRTVCNKAPFRALWSSLPAFVTLHDQILARISYVNACVLIQGSDTSGVTKAKTDAREKMTDSILEVAGGLSALALLRGDRVLEGKCDLHPSDLAELADTLVDDKATEILQLGRGITPVQNQPGLIEVGLTEGRLDLLETRIETYNLLLGSPRAARGEKTAATANLQAALDAIDRLLEKGLDKLVLQFKATDFYTEYQLARDPVSVAKRKMETEEKNEPCRKRILSGLCSAFGIRVCELSIHREKSFSREQSLPAWQYPATKIVDAVALC